MPIEKHNPATLLKPRGFAHAVAARGGTTVYLSGQLSEDLDGNLVGAGDYAKQAETSMINLNDALEGAGGTVNDFVKLTVFIVDHNHEHQGDVFRGMAIASRALGFKPVATLVVGITGLASPGALVEIEGIAVIGAE